MTMIVKEIKSICTCLLFPPKRKLSMTVEFNFVPQLIDSLGDIMSDSAEIFFQSFLQTDISDLKKKG